LASDLDLLILLKTYTSPNLIYRVIIIFKKY
jgi:hypothetical protein